MPYPKPMSPIDRRIQVTNAGLKDARRNGVHQDIQRWIAKLDEALDAKLAARTSLQHKIEEVADAAPVF